MKPIIILPPDQMSPEDVAVLRDNGLCVVEAKDPACVRFLDPLPATSSRTEIEQAAIKLSRRILRGNGRDNMPLIRGDYAQMFVQLLSEGTALDPSGTTEEQELRIITDARREELAKIGREEARAEQAAKKAAKAKAKPTEAAKP